MKRVVLLAMVVVAAWIGVTWGSMTVTGATPFKSPQKPPKQVTKYKFQGEGAFAAFNSTEGCVSNNATVFAGDSVVDNSPGKPVGSSGVSINVSSYDVCVGEYFFIGSGFSNVSDEAFSLQGNLQSATLNAEIPVEMFCCGEQTGTFLASISLSWIENGSISSGKTTVTSKDPVCKTSYTTQGDNRPALATGSISLQGIEFVPEPSYEAYLHSIKEATLTVGCN